MKKLSSFFDIQNPVLIIFVLLLFPFSNSAQSQNDDEVIRVNTDLVVLNVAVTDDKGKHLSGLNINDFKIFEDDKLQKITTFSSEDTKFAAVILIDTSGSMESRISLARSAAIRFLDGLRGEDYASVYNFDSKIKRVQDFSTSRDLAPMAYKLEARGMTVLYDAIVRASQELSKREEKRKAIIILSDGVDTMSGASMEKALNSALAIDATIYAVNMSADGSGNSSNGRITSILKSFADKTGGRFVATAGGPAMRDAFQNIVQELGQQYTIGYQPTNLQRDGRWRTIKVEVNKTKTNVRTRKGYNAPKN
jgi:Ca-activated chloride channel family protein